MAKLTRTEWEEIAGAGFLIALIAWLVWHAWGVGSGSGDTSSGTSLPSVGAIEPGTLPSGDLPTFNFPVGGGGTYDYTSPVVYNDNYTGAQRQPDQFNGGNSTFNTTLTGPGGIPVPAGGCGCGGGCSSSGCGGSLAGMPSSVSDLIFVAPARPVPPIRHATMQQLIGEFPGQVIFGG